jgi:hypothetical protein
MESLVAHCQERDLAGARSAVINLRGLFDPRLVQFSSNDDTVLHIYITALHERFGDPFIGKVLTSEIASPSLLMHMYTFGPLSPDEPRSWDIAQDYHASDYCISAYTRFLLTRPANLISNNEWGRRRLQMKKALGCIVECLWSQGLKNPDAILCVCQFKSFAFTPTELATLVTGFIGKNSQEPGYRRVTLRKKRKLTQAAASS